jgi:tetratricopeptide (TPR) repeat protein
MSNRKTHLKIITHQTCWIAVMAAPLALVLAGGCASKNQSSQGTETNATKLYVRGALDYQQQNYDQSRKSLDEALRADPNLIMARFLLGTIYREKGEYEAAAQQYQRVVQLDPYSSTNHYYLGLMNHLLNRLQEAAANYLTAIKLNPNDVKSNMYLGLVYTALGKPEQGLPYARRAVELDPRSGEAQSNLAVVLDASGDYAGAEAGYRRSLELDPNRPETLVNLAGALMSQKRFKDAVNTYDQALKMQDSPLVRVRYGYALLYSGQLDQAMAQFNSVLAQNPRNFQALNGLGDAAAAQYKASSLLDEKKRSDAVSYWKRSLDINPEQPRIAAAITEYSKGGLIP